VEPGKISDKDVPVIAENSRMPTIGTPATTPMTVDLPTLPIYPRAIEAADAGTFSRNHIPARVQHTESPDTVHATQGDSTTPRPGGSW
jgi:hypothetical protein